MFWYCFLFYLVLEASIKQKLLVNVSEEAGKNLDAGLIKNNGIERKKVSPQSTLHLFSIKPALKSTFV